MLPCANEVSHCLNCFWDPMTPLGLRYICTRERVAQYSDIGVAVSSHSVQIQVPAGELFQRMAERKIVCSVCAVDQRAVDIKKISVEAVPGAAERIFHIVQAIASSRCTTPLHVPGGVTIQCKL